jgi:tetratricopeptide (TPR) repeat protein
MANNNEKTQEINVNDGIADFIQKNRRVIITVAAGVVVLLAAFIGWISWRDFTRARAISRVEAFSERYESLRIDINDPSKAGEVQALLDELNAFGGKNSAYPGARAYSIAADIYFDKKDWAEAETAWIKAARVAPKIYLAPVALYNAAVAAEERGDIAQAIDLYTQALGYEEQFPAAVRAQYAIGRLREEQADIGAAVEAYRTVIEKWPAETVWSNLANSRIIAISPGLGS